jgi:catechol 2,3-dioxygenase
MTTPPANSASGPGVRLGHVALAVANPERLEAFYRDLVGLEVVRRQVNEYIGGAVLFSGRPTEEDHELVLLSNPQAAHVAFRVSTRAELAAFYRRALVAEVPMPLAPQDFGAAWSVFVTDPEGNACEVYWATGRLPAAPRPLDLTFRCASGESDDVS